MAEIPTVDVDEARRRAASGAVLLDVRTPEEWSAGRVAESVWIPMGEIVGRQQELPSDTPIVVVCRSGARSAVVTEALVGAGLDAVNLAGGLVEWAAQGHPLVDDAGAAGSVA